MEGSPIFTCGEVNERLKPFLEDLLAEDEYQAFVSHLDACPKCENYARSFGALSNQVWKLGQVEVFPDFTSTVMFKLKNVKQEIQRGKSIRPKRKIAGILILCFVLAGLVSGIYYFKNHRVLSQQDTVSVDLPRTIKETGLPVKSKTVFKENKTEPIVIVVEAPLKDDVPEQASKQPQEPQLSKNNESVISGDEAVVEEVLSDTKQVVMLRNDVLHWHFRYFKNSARSRLMRVLNDLGVDLDHQALDVLSFTAAGKKIEEVLEEILLTFEGPPFLQDFAAEVSTFPDREYFCSIYFEKEDASGLHWHIGFNLPHQQTQLLEVIQEKLGVISYRSKRLLVFSLPAAEVERLKARILAMRIRLSEFGRVKPKAGRLVSRRVEISIYF